MRKCAQWGILVTLTVVLGVTLSVVARERHARMRQLATQALLREAALPSFTLKRLRVLLEQDADVDAHGGYGNTPLILLIWNNMSDQREQHEAALQLLLDQGAKANAQNIDGNTALINAVRSQQHSDVSLLLRKGAQPDIQNHKGENALMIAAERIDVFYSRILLSKGANPNLQNRDKRTPLALLMAQVGAPQNTKEKLYKINLLMHLLISYGADANTRDLNGRTALMVAAFNGNLKTSTLLLREGARLNGHDENGLTALYYAAWHGRLGVFRLLVKKGADVHAGRGGVTILLKRVLASYDSSNETAFCARFLLENGADPNAYDPQSDFALATPLMIAADAGDLESVKLLLHRGARVNTKLPEDEYDLATALECVKNTLRSTHQEIESIKRIEGVTPISPGAIISFDSTREDYIKLWKKYDQARKIEKVLLKAGAKAIHRPWRPGV